MRCAEALLLPKPRTISSPRAIPYKIVRNCEIRFFIVAENDNRMRNRQQQLRTTGKTDNISSTQRGWKPVRKEAAVPRQRLLTHFVVSYPLFSGISHNLSQLDPTILSVLHPRSGSVSIMCPDLWVNNWNHLLYAYALLDLGPGSLNGDSGRNPLRKLSF